MRWRALGVSLAVLYGARIIKQRQDILPELPTSSADLPKQVQNFLELHNLTDRVDINLAAFAGQSPAYLRPSQEPDAPKEKRHPVVIVPGITSCGLEVWKAHPCLGDGFFRRRIWGDVSMVQAILNNWTCWLHHLAPDPLTGVDREGVRVRAAKGLRSADYFVAGFWLWAKLIENLADMGYDEDDIHLACYDWRLAFPVLEKRDRYFTGLRLDIERLVFRTGQRALVVAHSMGSNVWYFFMSWVEREVPGWCDKHVDSFVNIAGALLGAMGPLSAFISGEMDATAGLGPFNSYLEALALTFDEMRDIYWSIGGLGALMPMGGSEVWGSSKTGWTDTPADVMHLDPEVGNRGESLEEIYARVGRKGSALQVQDFPYWSAYERRVLRPDGKAATGGDGVDPDDARRFANPLASSLPNAPNMKIYCMYGVGQPTERAYRYGLRQVKWRFSDNEFFPEGRMLQWSSTKPVAETVTEMLKWNDEANGNRRVKVDAWPKPLSFPNLTEAVVEMRRLLDKRTSPEEWLRINTGFYTNTSDDPWDNGKDDAVYMNGVAKSDGDSTVPLVSLGFMCTHGWRELPEFNPAGVRVWTKEFLHEPVSLVTDPRGGPATAKHLDIIGNHEVLRDLLHIATGNSSHLQKDRILSNITKLGAVVAERVRRRLFV
mmetsp:Transcript_107350/g.308999  ORF Transcript_107350/g.308999 Transcript_107350/m.308999 type:complete len:659 (+) Transcript_107350:120-2096(+)|eukprot:CAMPEP_0170231540 /NCGR_PEP_ID=MMETSP0116_2-20130129/15505_1 /TAXON_ID=400756 /ORGANISM="Durinskia baltica, Strain CSIRO CS-38" /LENGTH=658 /DNA_ID=CAMNT_0010482313 /DNA_START=120 /DNA_END=2096 /DNA_ORIENTATION=-